MGAASDYLEAKLLGVTLCRSTFTAPTTVYAALATAVSGDATSVTEVSGSAYARQVALFTAPSGGSVNNSADVVFPEASGSWGTLTHVLLYDASSSGNLLYYGPLDTPQAITTGFVFEIPTGSLVVGVD